MKSFIKNNPIKLVVLLVIFVLMSALLLTAEPKGYCSGKAFNGKTGVYLTDEEFIFAALKSGGQGIKVSLDQKMPNPTDEMVKKFLAEYPDCCQVYRDSIYFNGEVSTKVYSTLFDRAFWRFQTIAVKVSGIENMRNGKVNAEEGLLFLNTCGTFLD